jgi:hypothetical protein
MLLNPCTVCCCVNTLRRRSWRGGYTAMSTSQLLCRRGRWGRHHLNTGRTNRGLQKPVPWWSTMPQAERSRVLVPIRSFHSSSDVSHLALGLTQPLTEISTRNLPGGKARPVLKADYHQCKPSVWNMGALTSHNPVGLHCLLQGQLCLVCAYAPIVTSNANGFSLWNVCKV